MRSPLIILFTNIWLDHYAGTEVVIRDLALGSLRRGHRPIVYSPSIGEIGEYLIAKGVAVIDDLRLLAETPDIIHAHHVVPCGEALIRFPHVPAINVCHAFQYWMEAPAHFPQIGAYVAIDEACRDRLVHAHGIDPGRVVVLQNAVDLKRLPVRKRPLPERPRRALAFGKATKAREIRLACEAVGLEFEAIGYPVGRHVSEPERELVRFDLVFASARSALEAMCCGCAVIACDRRGMAGLVTAENFAAMRQKHFGLRSFIAPVTVKRLIEEIGRYDRLDADAVSLRARREADLEDLLEDFDALYADVLSGSRKPSFSAEAHQAAVSRFLHEFLPRRPAAPWWPSLREQEALEQRCRELEKDLNSASRELARLKRSRLSKLGGRLRRGLGLKSQ